MKPGGTKRGGRKEEIGGGDENRRGTRYDAGLTEELWPGVSRNIFPTATAAAPTKQINKKGQVTKMYSKPNRTYSNMRDYLQTPEYDSQSLPSESARLNAENAVVSELVAISFALDSLENVRGRKNKLSNNTCSSSECAAACKLIEKAHRILNLSAHLRQTVNHNR